MPIVKPMLKDAPVETEKCKTKAKVKNPFGKKVSISAWEVPADIVEEILTGKCQTHTADLTSRPSALNSRED
jgi:hypothetical protein